MKKILKYTLLSTVLLSAIACDDMLNEVNYGNPTVEDMMTNPENVDMTVGQVYADWKFTHDHWG